MRGSTFSGAFLLGISLSAIGAWSDSGQLVSKSSAGVTVTVSAAGAYSVSVQDPGWVFAASVGQPLTGLALSSGSDAVGGYQEISFSYRDTAARQAAIRNYSDKPVVLFTARVPVGACDLRFPAFTYPQGLHHLAFADTWAHYHFAQLPPDSPWLFFDDSANAFVVSPASNFQTSGTYLTNGGQISAGIDARLGDVPAGFTHRTILVAARGINRAFDIWGQALTDLQGKSRPPNDADITLSSLGYWTDRGASYYYHYEPALGYAGTLLAVRDDFARLGIPLAYMQLDSWFYPKGPNASWSDGGGIYKYVADPSLFPEGLNAFREQLGLPLITHARWIDAGSPYRQQYNVSGNVAIDPRYWDDIMRYLGAAGVAAYEQDWLDERAQTADNLNDPNAFFDNMASIASAHGITMQYCMARPHDFLQSTRYNNLTTIRVTSDRFEPSQWNAFLYGSRLASALGVWPWADVFMSGETENLLLATLSAGVVGIGDAIGQLNKDNLVRVVRGDGIIVKPDLPLVPLDESYVNEARQQNAPMLASTVTDFGGLQARYLIAYGGGAGAAASFRPSSLGFSGQVYVYNYFSRSGKLISADETHSEPVGALNYYVIVPVGPSGIAFLGDMGQFVPLGKKRIAQATDSGALQVTVLFAAAERGRTLSGYAATAPVVRAVKGLAGALQYDATTHLFSVAVYPDADGSAVVVLDCGAGARPAGAQAAAVNAASYAGAVAPGSIATVFGLELAAATATASDGRPAPTLGKTQLSVAGIPAPLFYASPTQLNFQVPWETPASEPASLQVTVNGRPGNAARMAVAQFAPGIFTTPALAPRQGAVVISGSGNLAAPGVPPGPRPARPGDYISIFCTGLGPVENTPPTGSPAPSSPLSPTLNQVEVTIDGRKAEVPFAGLAPGFVGLYQVNARVPEAVCNGDAVRLIVRVGGATSNVVTIAIRRN
jgi:uncharacterized protein (TIGR03437 family)